MKKYIRVTMPDNSLWDVPAEIVAKDRAKYYAKIDSEKEKGVEFEKAYKQEFEHTLNDEFVLLDWAENNMDWKDVEKFAIQIETPKETSLEDGWVNGEKEIIEK